MKQPSGEQIELHGHGQRAVVVGVGGGLRSYQYEGADVLDGYGEGDMCGSGRGQLLLPWPNRVKNGTYAFDGDSHQLPLTEVGSRNAIHGLVRWSSWTVGERDDDRVVMEHSLNPQPGYPFALDLAVEYTLSTQGLGVRASAVNAGARPCPFGAGAHPYLTLGTASIDELVLQVPAESVIRSDERGLPLETLPVQRNGMDFRSARVIGATVLDNAFTDLARDRDGIARVTMQHPDSGAGLALWMDGSYPYVMVFSGDPLADVDRRALAVEPMTCPPNAFRSGESLVRLEPGERWSGAWGITPGR